MRTALTYAASIVATPDGAVAVAIAHAGSGDIQVDFVDVGQITNEAGLHFVYRGLWQQGIVVGDSYLAKPGDDLRAIAVDRALGLARGGR